MGKPITSGSSIRLQHVGTGRALHSHLHRSPLSGQQEVSGFDKEDTGDVWIVETLKGGNTWKQGARVRFQHKDTKLYLHSHRHAFGHPIPGQLEVTCFQDRDDEQNLWIAEEGVFRTQ